jgi:hypothetical protein
LHLQLALPVLLMWWGLLALVVLFQMLELSRIVRRVSMQHGIARRVLQQIGIARPALAHEALALAVLLQHWVARLALLLYSRLQCRQRHVRARITACLTL